MILQVAIGLLVGRSSSSWRSVASVIVIIVVIIWGSPSVLEAPLKSIDNAGADLPFAWLGGSKSVSSKRNGSKSSSGSFSM